MITFNSAPYALPGVKALVGVIGAPTSLGSDTRGAGTELGPRGIRLSYGLSDPIEGLVDYGDVTTEGESLEEYQDRLTEELAQARKDCERLIVLGGDDSVSLAALMAYEPHTLIHFDAHDDSTKSKHRTHGTWVRDAKNLSLFRRGIQIGVRAPQSRPLITQKESMYVAVTTDKRPESTVVVIDLDILDTPGVSVYEPGGWSSATLLQQVIKAYERCDVQCLVITECNPLRDLNDITQRTAFKLAYEYATHTHLCQTKSATDDTALRATRRNRTLRRK